MDETLERIEQKLNLLMKIQRATLMCEYHGKEEARERALRYDDTATYHRRQADAEGSKALELCEAFEDLGGME